MKIEQKTGRSVAMALIALVITGLFISGCSAVRRVELKTVFKTVSKTRLVKLENAKFVRADISMDVGELRIDGKANELLKAKFRYGSKFGEPDVEYSVRSDTGDLVVRSPEKKPSVWAPGMENRWDLSLTDEVPIELSIDLGVGSTILALGDLDLEELDVSGGAGKITIDLAGDWNHDVDVSIDQGLGSLELRLPTDFGVRVDVDLGLGELNADGLKLDGGDYVNDAYEDARNVLDIRIDQGAGDIILKLVD